MFEWPDDRLTRFEVARIIGARTLQISLGAPVLVKLKKSEEKSSVNIARQEFREIKIPMTIKRPMPDGTKSVINIKKATKNWLKDHPNE